MNENKEIKSTVFADLFCDDEKDGKKNFLSLYNAIHGTELTLEETHLESRRITQAIYKTFSNDISMMVNGRLVVLIEHQSTVNANMPLRCLEYYVHLLYGIVPHRARYKEALYRIPTPEFYVFYNGRKPAPSEGTLRLSDAFLEPQEAPQCELTVRFTNIGPGREQGGRKGGGKLPIVEKCGILGEYCKFMEIVAQKQSELRGAGSRSSEEAFGAYEEAIKEAISRGILADYLRRRSTEVINMFIGEYDYDEDMAVKAEEAREAGLEEGAHDNAIQNALNFLKMKVLTVQQIAQGTGLPLTEVQKLAESI